jgi:hypothetical protein
VLAQHPTGRVLWDASEIRQGKRTMLLLTERERLSLQTGCLLRPGHSRKRRHRDLEVQPGQVLSSLPERGAGECGVGPGLVARTRAESQVAFFKKQKQLRFRFLHKLRLHQRGVLDVPYRFDEDGFSGFPDLHGQLRRLHMLQH